MYLARKHTDMSFPEIGRFMGNKNHSTVILANRRIGKLMQDNAAVSWTTPEGVREQEIVGLVRALEESIIGPQEAAGSPTDEVVVPATRFGGAERAVATA